MWEKIVPARRVTLRSKTLQVRNWVSMESSCKSVEGQNFSNNSPAVEQSRFWLSSSLMVTKLSRPQLDYK